ncbi:hypothetical protein DY218_25720 [Streptomyces triticagri]|uniref:Uncharacterized protein n=1 Tax=Streptomyces triticagri TaxID=2293568 RepID=A0A372LYU7_9ACTN|nr:hypothetical protein [Streptomyces triticagri]RFU83832.1 hypothetical protein DY218_25720 [Streptomyces triticagri]
MTVRFKGTCAALEFDRGWLRLEWAEPGHDHWYRAGELLVPARDCVALALRPDLSDGRLHLAFRFRRPDGGEAGAEVSIVAEHAAHAHRFAEYLAHEYGVRISLTDPGEAAQDQRPQPAPGLEPQAAEAGQDDPADWLSSPVSASTQTLFRSVLTRLSGTAG